MFFDEVLSLFPSVSAPWPRGLVDLQRDIFGDERKIVIVKQQLALTNQRASRDDQIGQWNADAFSSKLEAEAATFVPNILREG